ncbi:MAG: YraN family protein [Rhodobacteraceae bacterium]|nr:YraN family protein [Paracoccaceae bacterium]
MSGRVGYLAGIAAEEQVAAHYQRGGYRILARRWRGQGGELDLVGERDGTVVFIEVKKSRTHATAALRLSARQIQRLMDGAADYLGQLPNGLNTDTRFDVALVDASGRIDIIENALIT